MKISGDMTPSKLMQYIHENKQRSADGNPFASKEDYKEGEEREVANYLQCLDPLSSTSVAIEDLAMFKMVLLEDSFLVLQTKFLILID